ncbi:hypothetical protein BpHYR1_030572 [Brachionus plicatilis]|uniref:Uncharacterized protein n=1 Tax=Brachionus plicatilis TaxID=10195 RepID=A0A3M7SQX8_BRAPC|nr:hypothetical protein BpHYR1_030572 [Brachionus plicatilis]
MEKCLLNLYFNFSLMTEVIMTQNFQVTHWEYENYFNLERNVDLSHYKDDNYYLLKRQFFFLKPKKIIKFQHVTNDIFSPITYIYKQNAKNKLYHLIGICDRATQSA